jgi:cytochrome c oxidase subunit 1
MYPPEYQVLNVMSTAGASVLGFGYLLPMIYLTWAWRHGKIAGSNPFKAKGLEWETTSPPPTFNFDHVPLVTEATHSYGHQEARVA